MTGAFPNLPSTDAPFGRQPTRVDADPLQQARSLIQHARFSEAERLCRDVVAKRPRDGEAMYLLGIVAISTGRAAQAVQWLSKALKQDGAQPRYHVAMGRAHQAKGDHGRAVVSFERALAIAPNAPDVLTSLGIALKAERNADAAEASFRRALDVAPEHPEALMNLANLLYEQGKQDAAVEAYRRALKVAPGHTTGHYNLGLLLDSLGRHAEAVACYELVRAIERNHVASNTKLAEHFRREGKLLEAIEAYGRALTAEPSNAELHYGVASALLDAGRAEEAFDAAERAFALGPAHPDLHYRCGLALIDEGREPSAVTSFRRATVLDPADLAARCDLAVALKMTGRHGEAYAALEETLRINPEYRSAWRNLGTLHQNFGRLDEALHCFRRAVDLGPQVASTHSGLLMSLNYSAKITQEDLTREHREYGVRQRPLFAASDAPLRNSRDPNRRLRVGLVSADFRNHSVAYFVDALFAYRDRANYELLCYYVQPKGDAYTARFRQRADLWRVVSPLAPVEELVEQVRKDEVDVLIDLAGHTAAHIVAFNVRCAPVQVTWLGYPTTSGAAAMDYRISDPAVDPEGWDRFSTEKLIRLSPSYYCYTPLDTQPAAPRAPVMDNGYVTFGTFNSMVKISDLTLSLWARILAAVPNARLVVKSGAVQSHEARAAFIERATAAGIAQSQLSLLQWTRERAEHLEAYNGLDIALDTVPYNGGTTTCEALWQGVPVVSLTAPTHAGRMGASILNAAGLPELLATSADDYVARAVSLAADPDRLNGYRSRLRAQLAASPLLDGPAFVGAFEQGLREAWTLWCTGSETRAITVIKPARP
jgi:predicted O-linked N-acetylglucosamine transferase (SPINDLY family)